MSEKIEFTPPPDVLVVYIVTPVADKPDQFIVPMALRSEANTAVGATDLGVLLNVIVYDPVVNHVTVTFAALLLFDEILADELPYDTIQQTQFFFSAGRLYLY